MNRVTGWLIQALRWPRLATVLLLAIIALGVFSLPSVRFDGDIHRVFLSDSPLSTAQRAMEARLPSDETVAILVEASEPLSDAQLGAARDVALDLELVDGIASVASPFSLRFPPGYSPDPEAPVFPVELAGSGWSERLAAFQALETGLPTLTNADDTALLILASVDLEGRDLTATLADIRSETDRLADAGLTVSITGEEIINLAVAEGLRAELPWLNVVGALIVIALTAFMVRDVRLVALATVPAVVAAMLTVAASVWLNYPLTVISNIMPVFVLILGVANGVHLALSLSVLDGERRERIETCLREVGPATFLTGLTTAVAFGSIMLTSNEQLFEFAMLGAVGILLSVAVGLPCFALLALAIAPPPRTRREPGAGLSSALGNIGLRVPRLTAIVGGVLLAVSLVGFLTTSAWFPMYRNLPQGSVVAAANDRIAEDFGGVFQAVVEMPKGAEWADLTRAVKAVEAEAPKDSVFSEVTLARWLGEPDTRPDDAYAARFPEALTQTFRDPEAGTLRFTVNLPEPMRSTATLDEFDRVEAAALGAGAERVLGFTAIMRHETITLIRQLSFSLLIASLVATGLIALVYRDIHLAPIVLAVNLLPVLAVASLLHVVAGGQDGRNSDPRADGCLRYCRG